MCVGVRTDGCHVEEIVQGLKLEKVQTDLERGSPVPESDLACDADGRRSSPPLVEYGPWAEGLRSSWPTAVMWRKVQGPRLEKVQTDLERGSPAPGVWQ